MNHELSTTTTIITNASSGHAKSLHQSSDCNRSESGTKRKRGRPKSPMGKKPWTLPVSKAFYEKMRRRGEMIMDALGYGAEWMKYLMPHLDAYMLKGEKLGYHYEYECMRVVFTCLCLDIDTAMQRSARAKARAAERRAAAEMTKAEKSEENKATERNPTEQATYSSTPETSISGPIPDVYNPAGADKLSLHRTKRFFRKNTLKIKRTQVRRV